jgi:hypothetical protein
MKLQIALLALFTLPLMGSEPHTLPHLAATEPKTKLPNFATILAVLNQNNMPRDCFFNRDLNPIIAEALAGQELTRMELSMRLHRLTQNRERLHVDPNCSAKANFIMCIARHVLEHPEDAQPE